MWYFSGDQVSQVHTCSAALNICTRYVRQDHVSSGLIACVAGGLTGSARKRAVKSREVFLAAWLRVTSGRLWEVVGRLREVSTIVIWLRTFWYFGKSGNLRQMAAQGGPTVRNHYGASRLIRRGTRIESDLVYIYSSLSLARKYGRILVCRRIEKFFDGKAWSSKTVSSQEQYCPKINISAYI